MNKGKKEIISVRAISSAFTVLTLAIFKPFGLGAWRWQAYVHLLVLLVLGVTVCMVTEGILKYIVRKPRSSERGVTYIIKRNLWFQIINTPLISLMICLYRHYVLSNRAAGNQLSWGNFFETLIIIGFASFAIGLYWRFKFRSKYLAAELEEIRMMNEELQKIKERKAPADQLSTAADSPSTFTLTGTTNDTVTFRTSDLLYIEAVGNYVKVYQLRDNQVRSDMLRATSKQVECDLQACPRIVRCHRAFLVNLEQVEQVVSRSGSMQLVMKHCNESIPVSRSNMAQVKDAIALS